GLVDQSLGLVILLRVAEGAHTVEQTGNELLFVWGHRGLLAIEHGADVRRRRRAARGRTPVSWRYRSAGELLENRTPGRDGPDSFHMRIWGSQAAHADVPVVQV